MRIKIAPPELDVEPVLVRRTRVVSHPWYHGEDSVSENGHWYVQRTRQGRRNCYSACTIYEGELFLLDTLDLQSIKVLDQKPEQYPSQYFRESSATNGLGKKPE
jgi:hypothetical protein